jgi:hypothetical protein
MNVKSSIFLRTISRAAVFAAVLALGALATTPLQAGVIVGTPTGTYSDPTGNIGARLRWGGSSFEAAIRRGAPANTVNANLNPPGTPAWDVGLDHDFQITWNAVTGTMGLSVDFDQNGFGAGESISHTFADRIGYGYYGLSIFGNQNASTATSLVSSLSINGFSQSNISPPSPGSISVDFKDSTDALLSNITIAGKLKFLTSGTGIERPAWDFTLRSTALVPPVAAVPEPASFVVLAVGFAGIGVIRRRRSAASIAA